ncbi:alpha-hydroxy-acid oxidizing protein [Nocardioides convexus]|uniref:alpha-hydroxy-acid oxidizing protein n=1 Tax=Nocardioides convexus TaxID=2712224 RepID=UPI00241871EC|nr:alpha-hydroxy-acid oxidizing protein [Nocardioides convexus]
MAFGDYQIESLPGRSRRDPARPPVRPRRSGAQRPRGAPARACARTSPGEPGTRRPSAPTSRRSRGGRWCRGCSAPSPSGTSRSSLFGRTLSSPLLLAPVGVVGLCTPDQHGDIHAAEVAAATGVPLIGSTLMSDPLEDVAAATGEAGKWFQALHPQEPRPRGQPRQPGGGGGLRGDRDHARHLGSGLAPARPGERQLPAACGARRSPTTPPTRSSRR